MLNKHVESLGLKCCFTNLDTSASLKVAFKDNQSEKFNCFEACES